MSQEKIRFKIVNKAKDGITLSARKGSKPQKISWDEFNQYYTIEDKVWAVPNEELVKKMEEVEEHINRTYFSIYYKKTNNYTDELAWIDQMINKNYIIIIN